jgi:two-component system, sensor histidine kinase and response regulator
LRDDTGQVIGTFGISRDISQKIRDERKLQAYSEELAKLNATKDKFFSIIAHDLKNPLMALLGFSDLVALSIEQNDINMIKKNVKIIKKASYQALELLSNLLDWARSQTGNIVFNPEMINLGTLSEDIVSLFFETARQKGISLCTSVPKDLFVFSDKSMTGIVLRNLVSNAIKFSCSGEKVEILAEEKEDIVEISVKDNGIGLSKEEISKLFSVTSQFTKPGSAKERGTGLGLILCKEFAEKQGGRIWVVSKPGKGSTFTFSIPKI